MSAKPLPVTSDAGAWPVDEAVRDGLVSRARGPYEDASSYLASLPPRRSASTVQRAFAAGARADRLGFAFVGGYFAALDALGGRADGRLTCLAATEVGGVHPKAIDATVEAREGIGLSLRGLKTFVTLAPLAEDLLVIARQDAGEPEGARRRLVALRIPADRDGIRIEARAPTPFAPEVPHARVFFEDVAIDPAEVLPGHGWDDWLKPFRTAEDVHILAATAGYLLAVAREADLLDGVAPDLAVVLTATMAMEREGWSSAGAQLALAGAFAVARGAYTRVSEGLPEGMHKEARRLERDAPLLAVAEAARQKRLALALTRVVAGPG